MKISATIITFNEERNIAAAIDSVSWADEIIVVDSNSVDRTRQIAEEKGARVFVNDWPGFSEQKQFAADEAKYDWILSLDADERVPDKLRTELLTIRRSGAKAAGYRMPRLSYYMGQPIKHSGWYPDRQLRFFDRRAGKWNGAVVHESVEMAVGSDVIDLKGELLHYSVESASHHHRVIGERYAPLGAEQMYASGKRTSGSRIATVGLFTFIRNYFLKGGFLDGLPGFTIATFAAHNAFLKHLMLWELQKRERSRQ